jgi:hypothetical protein
VTWERCCKFPEASLRSEDRDPAGSDMLSFFHYVKVEFIAFNKC